MDKINKIDLESLTKLAESYTYGQHNILGGHLEIYYVKKTEEFILKNFYSNTEYTDIDNNTGSCGQLMLKALKDIKSTYPQLYITRVIGNDDKFFTRKEAYHCFMLLSYNRLVDTDSSNFLQINDDNREQVLRNVLENNAVLFDPSFRRVVEFSQSGYTLKELLNEEYFEETNQHEILKKGISKPLIYSYADDVLMSLHYSDNYASKLGIILRYGNGKELRSDINAKVDLKKDNLAIKMIKAIRSAGIKEAYYSEDRGYYTTT